MLLDHLSTFTLKTSENLCSVLSPMNSMIYKIKEGVKIDVSMLLVDPIRPLSSLWLKYAVTRALIPQDIT